MNKLLLSLLIFPLAAIFPTPSPKGDPVEVRSGKWPINLERTTDRPGVSYSLIFRDQSVSNANVLDTLDFPNIEQLRYFGKGLTALKTGNNGDIARFKDYSLTRADKKFEGIWYILKDQYCETSFQQPEADIITKAIKEW
jgi:hypothetical protein